MQCIIVKRGDFQTYDLMYKTFGSRLPVIWDRRQRTASPDHAGQTASDDADRRGGTPASWRALGFVVVDR